VLGFFEQAEDDDKRLVCPALVRQMERLLARRLAQANGGREGARARREKKFSAISNLPSTYVGLEYSRAEQSKDKKAPLEGKTTTYLSKRQQGSPKNTRAARRICVRLRSRASERKRGPLGRKLMRADLRTLPDPALDVLVEQTLQFRPPWPDFGWSPLGLWRNTLPATWARATSIRLGIFASPCIHWSSEDAGTPNCLANSSRPIRPTTLRRSSCWCVSDKRAANLDHVVNGPGRNTRAVGAVRLKAQRSRKCRGAFGSAASDMPTHLPRWEDESLC
jgi:hypothetical protein